MNIKGSSVLKMLRVLLTIKCPGYRKAHKNGGAYKQETQTQDNSNQDAFRSCAQNGTSNTAYPQTSFFEVPEMK